MMNDKRGRYVTRWLQRYVDRLVITSFLFALGGMYLLAIPGANKVAVTLGGVVLGAGVTMLITNLTSRRAIHEQYAKDANLRRRDEIYGPLHAEMLAILHVLEQVKNKETPYPSVIVTEAAQTTTVEGWPSPKTLSLTLWTTFRM